MKGSLFLVLGMLFCTSFALSCPDLSDDCITWGNEKSMRDHSAQLLTVRCQDYGRFILNSSDWRTISVNFLDGATGKDSFAILIDGEMMGQVDDADKGVSVFATRMFPVWKRYTGKHVVELKGTEQKTCQDAKVTLNWVSVSHVPQGGGGTHVLRQVAAAFLPDGLLPPQEVPEYGTIGLVVAIIGGLCAFYFLRTSRT